MNIVTCFKELFSKKGLKKNIASYFILPIILFHLISFIIFELIQKNKINNQISDISFGISNWKIVEADEIERLKKIKRNKNNPKLINKTKRRNKIMNLIFPIIFKKQI